LASHYFRDHLPQQFDEYVWFDETRAVTPLDTAEIKGLPGTIRSACEAGRRPAAMTCP